MLFGTALPYVLYLVGIGRVGPTFGLLSGTIEPIVAVIAAWLWIDQRLSPLQVLGCAIVFAAVIAVQMRSRSGSRPSEPSAAAGSSGKRRGERVRRGGGGSGSALAAPVGQPYSFAPIVTRSGRRAASARHLQQQHRADDHEAARDLRRRQRLPQPGPRERDRRHRLQHQHDRALRRPDPADTAEEERERERRADHGTGHHQQEAGAVPPRLPPSGTPPPTTSTG